MKNLIYLLLSGLLLLGSQTFGQSGLHYLSATTGAASFCLEMNGDYMYSGTGNTFRVYDVSNGSSIPYDYSFVHRFRSNIDDFIISGDTLYVAANTDGIAKFYIDQPGNPVFVTQTLPTDWSEAAYDIAVKGDSLFVAFKSKMALYLDKGDTLELLQTFAPMSNQWTRIRGCEIKDNILAFVAGTWFPFPSLEDGVYLHDANNLSQISFRPETFCDGEELLFGENDSILHVLGGGQFSSVGWADTRGLYYVLDITNPALPVEVFRDTLPGLGPAGETQAINAQIRNDTVFLCPRVGHHTIIPAAFGKVWVYDATNPNDIQFISHVHAGLLHFDVALQGNKLHIASEWFGIRTMDISDLQNPVFDGDTRTGGWLKTTDIYGDRMVQANEGYGVQLFDISDPRDPKLIAWYDNVDSGFCFGVHFSADGQFVYALYTVSFEDFRVLTADSLHLVYDLDTLTGYDRPRVYGDDVLIKTSDNMVSIVTAPAAAPPVRTAQFSFNVYDTWMTPEGKAFISGNDSLRIMDMNNNYQIVGGLANTNFRAFQAMAMYKDTLFVYRNNVGLVRYDWNDATNTLTPNDTFSLPHDNPKFMAADSFGLYVGYQEYGLYAMDKATMAQLDYYRTGLDWVTPAHFGLQDLKAIDGYVVLCEYFGQTTLLSMDDGVLTAVAPVTEPASTVVAYPNPIRAGTPLQLNIPQAWTLQGPVQTALYDLNGRAMRQGSATTIRTDGLAAGTYFYVVKADGKLLGSGKVLVQ